MSNKVIACFIRLRQKTTTVKSWMSASGAGEISPMNFGGNGASRADTPRRYRRGVRLRRDFAEAPKETMGVLRQAQDGERSRTINPWCFILILACIAVFSNALHGEFIWDDQQLVVNNPLVKEASPVSLIFNSELHLNTSTNYYRPLQALSYKLDYHLYGLNPLGFHVTNLSLHILVVLTLFFFLETLTKNIFLAFVTCLLFGVHPLNTEVVSYISGRADSLAALFILASLFCFIKKKYLIIRLRRRLGPSSVEEYEKPALARGFGARQARCHGMPVERRTFLGRLHADDLAEVKGESTLTKAGPSRYHGQCPWGSISFFCFVLALLSKETAVMLPFIVLALDVLKKEEKGKRVSRVGPYFILSLLYIFLRTTVLDFSVSKRGFAIFQTGFIDRVWIFLKTIVIYIGSVFVPSNLHMERIIAYERIFPFYWLGIAAFIGMSLFLILKMSTESHDKRSRIYFSLLWFFIWLFPQSAFMQPKVMADHFLYMPSIGLFFMLALAIDMLPKRNLKYFILILLSVYFALFTFHYNKQWNNERFFFTKLALSSPQSFKAHDSLANLYFKEGKFYEAIYEYKLILDPDRVRAKKSDLGSLAKAVLAHKMPLEKKKLASIALYDIGVIFAGQSKTDEAIQAYVYAIEFNPLFKDVYNNLGLMYDKKQMWPQAEASYRKALQLDSAYFQAYNNLATLYAKKGDYQKAITLWEKALEVDAGYEIAKKNIALAKELIVEGMQK